jgi:hypothetical protein
MVAVSTKAAVTAVEVTGSSNSSRQRQVADMEKKSCTEGRSGSKKVLETQSQQLKWTHLHDGVFAQLFGWVIPGH